MRMNYPLIKGCCPSLSSFSLLPLELFVHHMVVRKWLHPWCVFLMLGSVVVLRCVVSIKIRLCWYITRISIERTRRIYLPESLCDLIPLKQQLLLLLHHHWLLPFLMILLDVSHVLYLDLQQLLFITHNRKVRVVTNLRTNGRKKRTCMHRWNSNNKHRHMYVPSYVFLNSVQNTPIHSLGSRNSAPLSLESFLDWALASYDDHGWWKVMMKTYH